LQQTPSTQCPLAHSLLAAHVVASTLKQAPGDALVAPPHAAPAPQLATPQHTPLVQKPVPH
jgi:hypothetical protein